VKWGCLDMKLAVMLNLELCSLTSTETKLLPGTTRRYFLVDLDSRRNLNSSTRELGLKQ
jgi:hypothetical protein